MAVRKPPTERQRRLGAELRKMRERAGLTLGEAARLHHTDRTTISNVESGRFGVSADRVRVWAANYACREPAYVDALAKIARERRASNSEWWDEYRDGLVATVLDLAELEHNAASIQMAQITHMPGLLQHEDYARAVFTEAVPPLAADDFERKLEFRIRRRCVLDKSEAPRCHFIVHETALCMRFGGASVMKRQLDYLLEQSDRANVHLRVLPFSAGGFPAAASSTLYACGPVQQLDTVQTDTPVGSVFLHAETHLTNYRAVLDRMRERSLTPDASRQFLREAAQRL